jgi:hypothetical protein
MDSWKFKDARAVKLIASLLQDSKPTEDNDATIEVIAAGLPR